MIRSREILFFPQDIGVYPCAIMKTSKLWGF